MQLIKNQIGVSLIELVIAVSLMATVVAALSLVLPKMSQNTAQTQGRTIATNLAQAQMQITRSSPYAFIDVTDSGDLDANCDCSTVPDLTVLPSTGTPVAGTLYRTATCVHFVDHGTPWTSQCAAAGDTGYKHIVVYVYWTSGNKTYTTSQESMISRF